MAIKLGNTSVKKLYIGDKAIYRAYAGEKLVFSSESLIDIFVKNAVALGADEELIRDSYNSIPETVRLQACVLLFPALVKENIVYAMNNQTGGLITFDFVRNSPATLFNKALDMQQVSENIPRIDFGNYSQSAKILIEKESTNLLILEGDNANWRNWVATNPVALDNYTFILEGTPSCGIYFIKEMFEDGINYTLSFLSQTISGTVDRYGGHSSGYPVSEIYLDKELLNGVSWQNGFIYPDDKLKRSLEVKFTKDSSVSSITYFYIQPNRPNYKDFVLKISNLQIETAQRSTSYIPTQDVAVTRKADELTYTLDKDCSVYLKTTKQNTVLDKSAGLWNIHEDVSNEGIETLAIFDRILSEQEKSELIS